MEKQISSHAAVAKAIRQYMKANGIPGRVTSNSYAGGSSVNVSVEDLAPDVSEKLKEFADQYEMGHFNGMEDIYEYSNSRDDIPQVQFVFVQNRPSEAMRQKIWDFARSYYAGLVDSSVPALASSVHSYRIGNLDMYADELISKLFYGKFQFDAYWSSVSLEGQQKAA